MNIENLQKTWQAQNASATVTLDTNLLLNEVRRNQRQFQSTIARRDAIEIIACILMTVGFFAWGYAWHWWSLYLLSACCFEVGAFFIVDRRRQRRKQPVKNDTVRACIESSLFQIKHQIWLLRNILWWYLLPPIIGVAAVTFQTVVRQTDSSDALVTGIVFTFTYAFTYGFVFWANQRVVKKQLNPRREELEALLASLKPEA